MDEKEFYENYKRCCDALNDLKNSCEGDEKLIKKNIDTMFDFLKYIQNEYLKSQEEIAKFKSEKERLEKELEEAKSNGADIEITLKKLEENEKLLATLRENIVSGAVKTQVIKHGGGILGKIPIIGSAISSVTKLFSGLSTLATTVSSCNIM